MNLRFALLAPCVAGALLAPAAHAGVAPATTTAPAAVTSGPTWAPASTATIHPGVATTSGSGGCTSNFIFTDGTDVFIGHAAHCTTLGGESDVNGCTTPSRPIGSLVTVQGATKAATMVYNSWLAMQAAGETDPVACMHNDFALLKLDAADYERVNPSVPFWGGPTGVGEAHYAEKVYSYGSSPLRFGLLSEKVGAVVGDADWYTRIYTATPGIPGDSGSGVLNAGGGAAGVITILEAAPRPLSNTAPRLSKVLDYMHAADSSLASIGLAAGTEPFSGI